MSKTPRNAILVVGSANMDLVVTVARFPKSGETIFGETFGMFPGGKGANQAVCCAKLGAAVYFMGKMGKDIYRDTLVKRMGTDGVNLKHLMIDPNASTGIALIQVDRSGQNEIVVVSGSNMKLTPSEVGKHRSIFSSVRVVLLQLETPVATVARSLEFAGRANATTILNPAPARALASSLFSKIDYLTPNESEIEILTGVRVTNAATAENAARKLLAKGCRNVIVTLGPRGSILVGREGTSLFPARKVKAVDTTAAGDAFNGALAFSLSHDKPIDEAMRFANAVAAFSVTRMGAQSSMPTMKEIERFL